MEFEYFWDKRRKENPGEPKYISLCYILQYSGEDKDTVSDIFKSHMILGVDYNKDETKQMIDYLVDISKDPND